MCGHVCVCVFVVYVERATLCLWVGLHVCTCVCLCEGLHVYTCMCSYVCLHERLQCAQMCVCVNMQVRGQLQVLFL